jgi:hypothetical protein
MEVATFITRNIFVIQIYTNLRHSKRRKSVATGRIEKRWAFTIEGRNVVNTEANCCQGEAVSSACRRMRL